MSVSSTSSNTSASSSSKKKWFGILAVVIVALAVGFGVLNWYEGKLARQIKEAVVEEYPGFQGEFSVSLLTSRISAKGVSYVDKALGMDFKVEAEEVFCKGLSTSEFLSGDIRHIDELSIVKYKATMSGDALKANIYLNGMKSAVVEADSFTLKDVNGEFVALYEKMRQNAPDEEVAPLLTSLRIGRYSSEKMRLLIDGPQKMSVVFGEFLGNDVGIEKSGPAHIKDLEVEFNGSQLVTIGLYGVDGVTVPGLAMPYLRLLRASVEGRMDKVMDVMLEIQEMPMEAKGFVLKDMSINAGLAGKIRMGEINADWKRDNAQNYDIRLGMKDMELPKTLVAIVPEGRLLSKHFDKPLVVSLGLDMQISSSLEDLRSQVDVSNFTLKVNDLLGAAGAGKLILPPYGSLEVAEMDATFTDYGVVEIALKAVAEQSRQGAGEIRKKLLDEISESAQEADDPASLELLKSVAAFIENPGVFKFSFKASPPVSVDRVSRIMIKEGSSIGLKSSASAK